MASRERQFPQATAGGPRAGTRAPGRNSPSFFTTEAQRHREAEEAGEAGPFLSLCLCVSVVPVFPDGNHSQAMIGKPIRENMSCAP